MRDYGKVSPKFWTGDTGKALKAKGPEAVLVALYLMTTQHANMLGLYYLSKAYIAVDTPLGFEGASKGLAWACEVGFCQYDEASEMVWVPEMAAYQIGEQLEAKDNRCKGVQREYDALPKNPFLAPFYERYAIPFHMTASRGDPPKKIRGSKAPSKGVLEAPSKPGTGTGARTVAGTGTGPEGSDGPRASRSITSRQQSGGAIAWDSYAAAYRDRYGTDPVLNAKVRSQMLQFVGRVPKDDAPHVAAWFLGHQNRWYVERGHSVDCLLKDAEKLRTEWATGRQVTATQASQADRTQTNLNAFSGLLAEAEHNHAQP